MKQILSLSVAFSLILNGFSPSFVSASEQPGKTSTNRVSPASSILIRYKGSDAILRLPLPKGTDIPEAIRLLKKDPAIDIVEANGTVNISAIPNDQLHSSETFLQQIHASAAWDITTGSRAATIAVLDSGVDINHPDLRNNIWKNPLEVPGDGVDNENDGYIDDVNGWDFVNEIPDPTAKFGGAFTDAGIHHGTVIAGIIAAEGNNRIGVSGVAWHAQIMPLRVLNNRGEGDILTVIKAIEYAINQRVSVMNLSFVGETDSLLLREALKRAYDAGVVVVAASGNDEDNRQGVDLATHPVYPACYATSDHDLVSVASIDGKGKKADYSNFGNSCITISAPGNSFTSTQVVRYEQPGFDKFYGGGWSGTSISTAVISGVAALLKSINPTASAKDVISLLTTTCTSTDADNPLYQGRLGCGNVNAAAAVQKMMANVQLSGGALTGVVQSSAAQIAVSTIDGKMPLRLFTKDGVRDESHALLPFDPNRIDYSAAASAHGNMIVMGAAAGGGPQVRVFDRDLHLIGQFLAYDASFRGGVMVAVGDVDGDGNDDIVTVPGPGGGPHVRIFDTSGHRKKQFFAYEPSFHGGLRVALGDMNGDGKSDIVLTAQRAKTEVRVVTADGSLMTRFEPYAKMSVSSVALAVDDVDGDGVPDIVTGPTTGIGPVRVFSSVGQLKKAFFPYDSRFRGGVSLAVGDLDQDRIGDIVVAPLSGGGPHVRIFRGNGSLLGQFFPLPSNVRRGLRVTVIP